MIKGDDRRLRMVEEISLVIGGEAGDGVRRAGNLIGRVLNRHGLHVFILDDYQSLIRGGHNFSKIRASRQEIWSHYNQVNLIVALNRETIDLHEKDLVRDGCVLFDGDEVSYDGPAKALSIPISMMVKEVEGIKIMRNSAAMGAIASLYGLDLGVVENVMVQAYGEKAEKNVSLAKKGYEYAEKNFEKLLEVGKVRKLAGHLLTGNEAIALGAVKAGLKVYAAYPMTPSTSILHYLAGLQDELGVVVLQPENEIGVINMALGSAYAGARSMVATSGGGFALMQEAVSLAGMSETPIVVVVCQRPGPSTGVPTYTAQGDLHFVLNAGHGDFPKIVLAPGDTEEAFYKGAEALNLAWKYQVPVLVLLDKHLSESYKTTVIDEGKVAKEGAKIAESPGGGYGKYAFTEDGISPLAFPGTPGAVVKAISYEHDEYGYTTEKVDEIVKMQEKRIQKLDAISRELRDKQTVGVYGDENADDFVVAWGSTKGAVLEAMKLIDRPLKFLQIIYLGPFPSLEVTKHLEGARQVVCVECNATGQLARLIRGETGYEISKTVLKYDARPFDPPTLAARIEEVLG